VKYKITITPTADKKQQYVQIISADQFSTNIVLIGEFELLDTRPQRAAQPPTERKVPK
jgi:hypothetical protein